MISKSRFVSCLIIFWYVINVGGYIGSSTRSEIEYAMATGKPVRHLEETD